MISFLNNLKILLRPQSWLTGLISNLFFILIYLIFIQNSKELVILVLVYIAYQTLIFVYSYLLNTITDEKIDKIVNKEVGLGKFPKWFIYSLLIISGLGSFGITVLFNLAVIGLLELGLATFYSIKPTRLKERGFLGIITATVGSVTLPFVFFISIVGENQLMAVYFTIIIFFMQMIREVLHQIQDYPNDLKTNTKTWAVEVGNKIAKGFLRLIVAVFLLSLIGSFAFGFFQGLFISVLGVLWTINLLFHSMEVSLKTDA